MSSFNEPTDHLRSFATAVKDALDSYCLASTHSVHRREILNYLQQATGSQIALPTPEILAIEAHHEVLKQIPISKVEEMQQRAALVVQSLHNFLNATQDEHFHGQMLRFLQDYCSNISNPNAAISRSRSRVGEFELFPDLPAELRLLIWKAALPGPETAHVFVHCTDPAHPTAENARVSVNRPVHPLFRVNLESRQVALEKYSLQLVEYNSHETRESYLGRLLSPRSDYVPQTRRIDPLEDALWVKMDRCFKDTFVDPWGYLGFSSTTIRTLVIDEGSWESVEGSKHMFLMRFPGLKKVIFVVNDLWRDPAGQNNATPKKYHLTEPALFSKVDDIDMGDTGYSRTISSTSPALFGNPTTPKLMLRECFSNIWKEALAVATTPSKPSYGRSTSKNDHWESIWRSRYAESVLPEIVIMRQEIVPMGRQGTDQ